jgi:hypothetical protein
MDEEIRYPVCPYRNVPAAFQRFLGPDSGGIERFFPDSRAQQIDGTLLIVRLHGKRAVSGAVQALEDFNASLAITWTRSVSACSGFALAAVREAAYAIRLTLHRVLRLYRAEIHRPA